MYYTPQIVRRLLNSIVLLMLVLLPSAAQVKRALLVGISNYEQVDDNSWNPIHGANDIDQLTPTLKSQGFRIRSIRNQSATAKKIRHEMEKLILSSHPGEIVYLHFSCHGQPFEDTDGDEDDGWDEALIPFDAQKVYQKGIYEGEMHITDDELNGYLKALRKRLGPRGFVYVVIDACHAGSSYRGDEEEDSVIIRGTDKGFSISNKLYAPRINKRGKIKVEKSIDLADICIIEACRSYQVNSEIFEKGKYYGSLSFYVNKTLQSMKLNQDISWVEHVVQLMNMDKRLIRQNAVVETSL